MEYLIGILLENEAENQIRNSENRICYNPVVFHGSERYSLYRQDVCDYQKGVRIEVN